MDQWASTKRLINVALGVFVALIAGLFVRAALIVEWLSAPVMLLLTAGAMYRSFRAYDDHEPSHIMVAIGSILILGVSVILLVSSTIRLGDGMFLFVTLYVLGSGFVSYVMICNRTGDYYEHLEQEARRSSCSRCEYDLRGTLQAGGDTCPECGSPIECDD
ncbi:MAG: hypothetical protein CMJ18_03100 [Phycisphaeraceae bacterium]|nr:hypothetical protein [Phycisphaeraceae bacterium]